MDETAPVANQQRPMRDKIVRGGLAVLLRQLFSLPVNAIGVTLISRLLKPAVFGAQAVVTPAISVALMAVDLGTSQALVQGHSAPSRGLRRQVNLAKLLASAFTLALLYALGPRLMAHFNLTEATSWLFPACGLVACLQSYRAYRAVELQRQLEWPRLAAVEVAELIVYNVTLVVFAYLWRSVWCFAVALAARWVVGAVLLRIWSPRLEPGPDAQERPLGALLGYSLPLQATSVLGIANALVNPMVVGRLHGVHASGIVNWTASIIALAKLPFLPLPNFLFSVFAERNRQGRTDKELIASATYAVTLLVALFSLMIVISLDLLVAYLFGSRWREAIPLVLPFILHETITFPWVVMGAQLTASGHSRAWLALNVVQSALLWGFAGAGGWLYDLKGYVIGWVVASFIGLVITGVATRRLVQLNLRSLDVLVLSLLLYLSMLLGGWVRGAVPLSLPASTAVALVAGVAVFTASVVPLGYLFRRRESQDLLMFIRWTRRALVDRRSK
ncbi:MAG: oligosaccharide flippase family protein [Deltaproteobacteria bacterium]|nr:oligosaccharide flippase family protein [Deltaproteobacteria bacterium]